MAKAPEKKQNFFKLLTQAFKITARHDKALVPILIGTFALVAGGAAVFGLSRGSTAAIVYASIFGVLFGLLAAMFILTRRFEKVMFSQMEDQLGGSLAAAQSIRMGWTFEESPLAVDPNSGSVIFYGVGRGGIVLLVEGGNAARKHLARVTQRLSKLAPGVKITPLFVGKDQGQVPLKRLTKAIRAVKRNQYGRGLSQGLSKTEMAAVRQRLKASAAPKLPVPKGIDPLRARPDRKGMRGR